MSNIRKLWNALLEFDSEWRKEDNMPLYILQNIKGCQKSLAVFPQACLCKRVVLVVFVASVHARAFCKALFTR